MRPVYTIVAHPHAVGSTLLNRDDLSAYLVVGGPGGALDPLVGHQVEVPLSGMVDPL